MTPLKSAVLCRRKGIRSISTLKMSSRRALGDIKEKNKLGALLLGNTQKPEDIDQLQCTGLKHQPLGGGSRRVRSRVQGYLCYIVRSWLAWNT